MVVIGGGITGCSVAYHLAKAGWRDVLLVEKGQLTSGSTCHAAGLVTQFNPSPTMMRFRRYSVELYRELGVFDTFGSLRIASSEESLAELRRGAEPRRAGIGLDVEVLGPEQALEVLPAASGESLYGGVWIAEDGCVDPHTATHALADAARALGARIATSTLVTGIELDDRGAVPPSSPTAGRIETEHVVNACGIWAPQVSAMVGAFTPSVPVDHQHIALMAVPGHELPRDMPCFRDTDNLVYGRSEAGGVLFGGYEPDPVARWVDGVPWSHSPATCRPTSSGSRGCGPARSRRFPFLEDAGVVTLVCHPDAMTPDGNPLLGPMPGVPGFWMAAGLSLNGFGGAGGIGKTIAEWMTTGETELDTHGMRAWRFGAAYRDPAQVEAAGREVYRYYYRLRYPLDADIWGRPNRLSPLHGRMQDLGAVFGVEERLGARRPPAPGMAWRRAGEDQRAYGWHRPPELDRVAEEHRRSASGRHDRHDLVRQDRRPGPGRAGAAGARGGQPHRPAAGQRDLHPVGEPPRRDRRRRHGHAAGRGAVPRRHRRRRGRLRPRMAADERPTARTAPSRSATCSEDLAVIGHLGPARARRAAGGQPTTTCPARRSASARRATIDIGRRHVLAQRITYVGELGFELYVGAGRAVQVWDRLTAAGAAHGIAPAATACSSRCGSRRATATWAPTSRRRHAVRGWPGILRRAGQRRLQRPRGAGRGDRAGARRRADAAGRRRGSTGACTAARPSTRTAGGGPRSQLRLRLHRQRNIAYAYLPAAAAAGDAYEVEVLGELVPARVAADVLYDPSHERVRG